MNPQKTLSVVVPVFNEEGNLLCMHNELMRTLRSLSEYLTEIIYVDDGSRDGSWNVISQIARKEPVVRGLSFSRNFGHQSALEAGLISARGDAVITIDADMEQPPQLIPELVAKWEEGNLIVNTKRNGDHTKRSYFKAATSSLFYWGINKIAETRIEPASADFRLLDRRVVNEILSIQEDERFFRGLIPWTGYQSAVVEYHLGDRQTGASGYNLKKMLDLATTAVTSYSTAPLKLIIPLGFAITLGSLLLLMIMAIARFGFGSTYFSEMAFLVVFIIANNGIILSILGVMAMYVLRIHKTVQHKPKFLTRATINVNP